MSDIVELSLFDIKNKYKLGFDYAKNVIIRLEQIGYIRKKTEYRYEIIRTESEIDNYIMNHLDELRPAEYEKYGVKDNGNSTFESKLKMNIAYYKIIIPIFVRRILFSIPQAIFLFFWMILLIFMCLIDESMGASERIAFCIFLNILSYIFIGIPINIIIRILQAKIYKMKFKDFMLLPKKWFFDRCKYSIDLCKIFYENKIKFYMGNYEHLLKQLEKILEKKKTLAEHYANVANSAENENEFYQSINSYIDTLKWMEQFEKFGIFPEGQKPSDDIKAIKDGMPISIERFHERIREKEKIESFNYDYMDGHQFEHFCADLLQKNGFINVEVTQGSGDHGIDILAEKEGISYAIQCKCYSSNIGNAAVQQAYTGKGFYNKDISVVLTNQYFTSQAKEEACKLGVKLWNRDKLNDFIEKANVQ